MSSDNKQDDEDFPQQAYINGQGSDFEEIWTVLGVGLIVPRSIARHLTQIAKIV